MEIKEVEDHVRPGERNPIEGVFGRAKSTYGMNRIKARLDRTSASWIASILMVFNLVKLTGLMHPAVISTVQTFSALVLAHMKQPDAGHDSWYGRPWIMKSYTLAA